MPKVFLKNRGNGPRTVIGIDAKAVTLPVSSNRDADPVEVEVDDHTLKALQEGSEAGGDLEVTSASRARMSMKPGQQGSSGQQGGQQT